MVVGEDQGGTYGIQKAKSSQGGDMKVLGLRTWDLGSSWLCYLSSVSLIRSLNFSLPQSLIYE